MARTGKYVVSSQHRRIWLTVTADSTSRAGRGSNFELGIRDLTDQVEVLTVEVHDPRWAQSFDQKRLESKKHETSAF